MAGLWDHWEGEGGKVIESCAIITTEANGTMSRIHDRMPVILETIDFNRWLSPGSGIDDLLSLLVPCRDEVMDAYPVSSRVNYPKNNGPDCIARLA